MPMPIRIPKKIETHKLDQGEECRPTPQGGYRLFRDGNPLVADDHLTFCNVDGPYKLVVVEWEEEADPV